MEMASLFDGRVEVNTMSVDLFCVSFPKLRREYMRPGMPESFYRK